MQEDQNTELKEQYSETFLKTAVAFSNGNGGRIIFGVKDDGAVIGLSDPDDTCKRCAQALADKVRPDVTTTTKISIIQTEGLDIVEISVRPGPRAPYYLRDKGLRPEGVFVRTGTVSVPATDDAFYHLMNRVKSSEYEMLESFRQDLTFRHLSKFMEMKELQFDEKHMMMLHMLDNGRYTNLGFVLSDQFDQPIKMAVFQDEYKSAFLDRGEACGSVLQQAEEAISFIMKHNRLSSTINGLYRNDLRAYPEIAVREAVLNAIIHRDYSSNASTLISIFPDRLTILSPGSLITYATTDELFNGISSLRNKNLASVFYRLELIEAYGTGLPRIMDAYRTSEKRPTIRTGSSTFSITLPALDVKEEPTDSFLKLNDRFTRAEFQNTLGISKSDAVSRLNELVDKGRLTKIGEGRGTKYRVI